MNHSFACAKDAQKELPCSKWCGNKHTCLSTRTYRSDAQQEAYEQGHHDAKWAMEQELVRMTQNSSPQRRVAAEDLYRALCKIKPVAFDVMPKSDSTAEPQPLAVRLHRALERARRTATFFRFDGDGQFGTWYEARADERGAVAFYTADDIRRIVEDVAGVMVGAPSVPPSEKP